MQKIYYAVISICICMPVSLRAEELCQLQSSDQVNAVSVQLSEGRLTYNIERYGISIIAGSPLGLQCDGIDFTKNLRLVKISEQQIRCEQYQLMVGNNLSVESELNTQTLTFKNSEDESFSLDLVAANQGIGFRYCFEKDISHEVTDEQTGFKLPKDTQGWMQPYHAAGPYTPAYEDFYFNVSVGELPPDSRAKARGWCFPALFHVSNPNTWMLLAETDVDAGYCACHLENDAEVNGLYRIKFAYTDEVTEAKKFYDNSKTTTVSAIKTPWRVIVMGDKAADIFVSTLVTDLAKPSEIRDTSWIKPGRASWSWWSHPDGPDTTDLYNSYTDLAADFGWEYTLFDAGWWNADIKKICSYAVEHNVKPLIWTGAGDFLNSAKRTRKLDEMAQFGARGIKVDFWCSDTQETMAAMHELLKESAERKLIVVLHGCTVPRGWHRTWPNLLTAEAVLGVESYFYENSYPSKTAEQNTILPFTRNVMSPMDVTPVGLTMRKFARKTTGVHEIAAAIIGNSGIIHYADSIEMFIKLPVEVKQLLKESPAKWDETKCLIGEPGKAIVVARRAGRQWIIAGLNGTDDPISLSLDLMPFRSSGEAVVITEGKEPLMQFAVRKLSDYSQWDYEIPSLGGFIISIPAGL